MSNLTINLTNDEIIIDLPKDLSLNELKTDLKSKTDLLQNFNFEEKKIPITLTGSILSEDDFKEIATIIKEKADTKITYKKPNSLGLHNIQKTYEANSENTLTKFVKTSLRSGQKIEHDGSIVIMR